MLPKFFHIILESNTFNFLIFTGLILLIFKKINLGKIITDLQQKTETEVNNSVQIKKDSQATLTKAENKIKNVKNDIEGIIQKSEKTAKTIAENIIKSSKNQIEIIENNAQKTLENDICKSKRELNEFTVKKSIELTRANIKTKLEENNSLHQKYIDEALNELEGITL